jgi:hypothetical protein
MKLATIIGVVGAALGAAFGIVVWADYSPCDAACTSLHALQFGLLGLAVGLVAAVVVARVRRWRAT